MRLLPSVDQEVLLQVSKLGEAFVTGLTFERSLTTVDTEMNLTEKRKQSLSVGFVSCKTFCDTPPILKCHQPALRSNDYSANPQSAKEWNDNKADRMLDAKHKTTLQRIEPHLQV